MKYISYEDKIHFKSYNSNKKHRLLLCIKRLIAATVILSFIVFILYVDIILIKCNSAISQVINLFQVKNIEIQGNKEVSFQQITFCLQQINDNFMFNAWKIQNSLLSCNPFIKNISVQRFLPDKLILTIKERKPRAIWRNHGKFLLIDQEGYILRNYVSNQERAKHIILFGPNANKKFIDILDILEKQNNNQIEVASLHFIEARRWNILLLNGVVVKLPENKLENAIMTLFTLLKKNNLSGKIQVIDLRLLPEKIFVR